jgi:hypothetical protein
MLGESLIALFTGTIALFYELLLEAFVGGLVVPFFDFLASALGLA